MTAGRTLGDEALSIDVVHLDRAAMVAVAGELDMATAPLLQEVVAGLIAAGHTSLVVDLAALTFCDCRGVGVFVRADDTASSAGGRLSLHGARPPVALVLELSGLERLVSAGT